MYSMGKGATMKPGQQIIIFEGPDGCGKSNISQALSELTGIPYFKNKDEWSAFADDPAYFVNALSYGDPYFLSYLEQTRASVIIDRWYPSEWVYSKIFGRPTNPAVLRMVDHRAASLGAKIVLPYRTSYDRVVDQFADVITPTALERIAAEYRAFAEWTQCETLFVNVDDENIDRELSEIREFLER